MTRPIIGGIVAAFFISLFTTPLAAKSVDADVERSGAPTRIAERVDHYLEVFTGSDKTGRRFEIHEPDASFIKLHFSQFKLPRGMIVEVSNPSGTETYRYASKQRDRFTYDGSQGDDGKESFSAMSISGDRVIIQVTDTRKHGKSGRLQDTLENRVLIDSMLVGYPVQEVQEQGDAAGTFATEAVSGNEDPVIQRVCGSQIDFDHAICYAGSDPLAYDRSRPVAKILTSGGFVCTAWRVGPDNRMMTDRYCVAGQANLTATEVWFNYQKTDCFYDTMAPVTKVTVASLLKSSQELNYSLFTINDFDQVSEFGYFGLDVREAVVGENIYIPHHANNYPKQLSIESDMNVGGLCQVDSANEDGNGSNTDIGFFCDTYHNSDGAPVVASSSNRVIALNHQDEGLCYNRGVKMSRIWPEISAYFGGEIPAGDYEDNNQLPEAKIGWLCSEMRCSFNGSSSSDPDGSIVGYHWDTGDGRTNTAMSFTHDFAAPGTYTITLTVEDNEGGQGVATSQVTAWSSDPNPNQPPNASFSFSCNGLQCSFNAGGSSDPDGTVQSYQWNFGDGSSQTVANPILNHAYAQAGNYTVSLTVVDDDGANDSVSSEVTVLVSTPNIDPTANFSSSCEVDTCSFDAGGSFDTDGSIVSYDWDFGDGQNMQGGNQASSHTYASAGDYSVTLTVHDNAGGSDSIVSVVNVPGAEDPSNQPPVAGFTFSCNNLSCSFNGYSSSDTDGSIQSYLWSFGDGSSSSGATGSHTYGVAGTYQVTLTVTDDDGASNALTKSVTASSPPNQPPVAGFTFSCNNLSCSFNGYSSSDADGSIQSYQWSFGDGSSSSGATGSHTYGVAGTYQVTLTVTDDDGAINALTKSVTVSSPPNQPPTASFTYSCNELSCAFNGSGSGDSDGSIVSHTWSFGDGSNGSGSVVSHAFSTAGSYQVNLTVMDDAGESDSQTRTVQVTIPEPGINVIATGNKYRGNKFAELTWDGATTSQVRILRDGSLLVTTPNDGTYTDSTVSNKTKTVRYQVCDFSGSNCSQEVTVRF